MDAAYTFTAARSTKEASRELTNARTSKSHPLRIAAIDVPGTTGKIGLTLCPGKKDKRSLTGVWARDLKTDIAEIKAWGADAVVCLMEEFELGILGVAHLPNSVKAAQMKWIHLAIRDVDIPDASFALGWIKAGAELHSTLSRGGRILIHCRGGLGRSGVIAAQLLIERGMDASSAIALVREHRPGAIETWAQENYVRAIGRAYVTASAPRKRALNEDQAIGCLLGLAIGDALGTTLEFSARDSLPAVTNLVGGGPFRLKPGEWTDDTSMALCLADSLLARAGLDTADLMSRFHNWRDKGHNSVTGECFDIGITTTQAISRYVIDGDPIAGSTAPDSAGNGSIMRLAPVPILFWDNQVAGEDAAVLQSRTTHGALECLDACRLMTRILSRLISGANWQEALANPAAGLKAPKIRTLASAKWRGKKRDAIRSTGYVVDTLEAALWAVDSTTTFSEATLLAVNLGGDADTVGAVTGQLAGARYGMSSLPKKWVARLAWSDKICDLAQALYRSAKSASPPNVDRSLSYFTK